VLLFQKKIIYKQHLYQLDSLNYLNVSGLTYLSGTTASTVSILNSGVTTAILTDWNYNTINTGVTTSNIIGGSGNTISKDLSNVQILGGLNITAATSNRTYVNSLTGITVYAGTLYSGSTDLSLLMGSGSGEVNTGSNVGSGNALFKQKSGVDLQFRTISAGTNITIVTGDTWTINSTASGSITSGQTVGTGIPIFSGVSGTNLAFRSISAGTNITITSGDTITINSTGSGSNSTLPFNLGVAASDEASALTVGNSKITFLTPRTGNLTKIVAGLSTSGSTTTTVRVNKNGTVVSSANIDIATNLFSSSITTPTLTATTFTAWDTYTVDITAAGTGAKGLKVYFEGDYSNPFTATTTTIPWELGLAITDESTQIATGTTNLTMLVPFSGTVSGINISLSTSGSTTTTVNVKNNGVTIFSTKPTIDNGKFSSLTSVTQPVITGTTFNVYDTLVFSIDTAGSGATGMKAWLTGTRNI